MDKQNIKFEENKIDLKVTLEKYGWSDNSFVYNERAIFCGGFRVSLLCLFRL